ncbi:Adenosylcobinamide kinase (EC 2.7.1.156) / Adenosylcobinamide-phosphate guanylyltransferase (EC 2.7.7.62) [Methylomonas albis]|uniref:Bifunctional adenosylcobalamin biosynthesis protein n=1 Tax=Methylomonas albis TaxID=1854563 RepID=A0ABR9D6Y6_9GAMM|nr:bifunctional adenosylcobinamide kinase/adenosylcobinamide-phosphate guanylyltransferase [Methylomonas albis]MBD9358541.1 bifunctional adenosylcobinamide kinase/adenosylcobinamide-phosphate guanylyltransferase [Methylomonas albis]CAD6881957.1 Adenosylcobinamide kinase (EC 2.7.1.156) / Adenosylcobinamide-phosphate guanylyltransferase (EC 2.7.7.62) [Methylomonas albis]
MIELVLGGARSGKSRYAEQQALACGLPVVYIATAEAGDDEMHSRIQHHQQRRPAHWLTVEEPIALAKVISEYAGKQHCLLVDCLTLWLCNVLFDKQGNLQEQRYRQQADALCAALATGRQRVIMVSNEVGLGVVAADAMTRRFVDEAGFLHQKLAQISDKVVLVTAGLPQILKHV